MFIKEKYISIKQKSHILEKSLLTNTITIKQAAKLNCYYLHFNF